MGSIFDALEEVIHSAQQSEQNPGGNSPPTPVENTPQPSVVNGGTQGSVSPPRTGTFILPDVYPLDPTGPLPPFQVLPGLMVQGKTLVGCYLKASDGVKWLEQYENWFITNWERMAQVTVPSGAVWGRGCYAFLQFSEDGAAQADYFASLVDRAGGWRPGDMMPWCDCESGGQGSWNHGVEDLSTLNASTRASMASDVTRVTTAFVTRLKQHYPGIRVGLYGRGLFRDLGMTDATFGCDAVVNPAYTATMPSMEAYGWPLDKIIGWQCSGDGVVELPGYPSEIPGWGKTDYTVAIDGPRPTTLESFQERWKAF